MQYTNNILSVFVNPFAIIRIGLYNHISLLSNELNGKVLDIGCGTKPYKHLFKNIKEYIGVDLKISGNRDKQRDIDIFYNGKVLPFENESIDNVFSSETFEHIFNIEEIIQEIHRVLKPGGKLLTTTPFCWPEHEIPYDYARYSSFALVHLYKKYGFEIITNQKSGSFIAALCQLWCLYIFYFIPNIPVLKQILIILLISPFSIIGIIFNTILPNRIKRKDLYLNNIFLVKKI